MGTVASVTKAKAARTRWDGGLTAPQKLLLAAARLEAQGFVPFTAEQLVVSAWHEDAETFGLDGFKDTYPDSNKALASLMGQRGLVSRGWFVQAEKGKKRYALSDQARAEAGRLARGEPPPPTADGNRRKGHLTTPALTATQADRLEALVHSTAYARFKTGMRSFIVRDHAEAFLRQRPAETLAAARAALVGGRVKANGGEVTARQVDELQACAEFVHRAFGGRVGV